MAPKRRGAEMRMVVEGNPPPSRVDRPLLKAVARAYRWSDDLLSGWAQSVAEIARRERVTGRYVWRLIRLGFLASKIVEAIVDGRHPKELTAIALTQRIALPALWSATGAGSRRRLAHACSSCRPGLRCAGPLARRPGAKLPMSARLAE